MCIYVKLLNYFQIVDCYILSLQRIVYKLAVHLPITLPLEEISGLTPFDEVADKVHYLFAKAGAGKRWPTSNGLALFTQLTCTKDLTFFPQLTVPSPETH